MQLTGAEILIECLKKEKVEIIFGIPGGVLLPAMDVLYKSSIQFVLTRHEQGAGHMADGYARATGKVGVTLATSGPGATNLTTALATAHMDSIPMVAITGQVATHLIGNDAFQEADTTGITRPVTKHNFLVNDVRDLAATIKKAFYIARTGRPGPVVIDLPVDVQKASAEFIWPEKQEIRSYNPNYKGHIGQIKKAAEMINKSQKPVLYIGGGVVISNCGDEVLKLAEKADILVTTTLMALGEIPAQHPLYLGMLGMHGTYSANMSMQNADLIIAVGARFDDRITGKISGFAPHAKIIHIDIDPTSISKNVRAHIPVVGDAKMIVSEMLHYIKHAHHKTWRDTVAKWRKKTPDTYYKNDNALRPQYVIEQIHAVTKGNAIVATEVGQNQMWSAQFYRPNAKRHFLTSGGLGTMGYGLPAAIGAKFARPEAVVFDIAGDGSIQMNIQELAVAVLHKVNVKIAILNNSYLGMVRQWQSMFYGGRFKGVCLVCSSDCTNPSPQKARGCKPYVPDFVKLAEAYGAVGIRVLKKKDVKAAIQKALKIDKPVILEFIVESGENVYPMVPAGASLHEMITGLA
ncbi:MAG: biosynthetic-type acetolactate synthase large subunit [bacterium]